MFIEGRKPDVKNIIIAEEVYSDAKKGEKAKGPDIQKVFGTTDILKILEFVLRNGEIQLTTEQRRKKVEERYKQIVAILLREAIDPRTNAPHTQHRIETAIEEAKFHVDPQRDPREQLDELVKKLRPIIPLKFEKVKLAVKVPAAYAHRCYGTLKGYGIQREEWSSKGDLIVVVEIFGGMQGEFLDKLNKLTVGEVETKQLPG
jgi:ribosome maturation protein SDO1